MATKKKAAKKTAAKKPPAPTIHLLKLLPRGGTSPKRLPKVAHGDLIKVFGNKKLRFDVTVTVEKLPELGVGGGPIIIHS